jgi:hypothetical protein
MDENYFFLIFTGVGLLLLAMGVFAWLRTRRFISESLRAPGTVVGLEPRRGSKGGTTYSPVVEFATPEGVVRQFTDPVSSNPAGYSVGDRVEVLYHWQDHARARLASKFRLYFVAGLLSFLGLIFTGVGAVIFLFAFGGRDAPW